MKTYGIETYLNPIVQDPTRSLLLVGEKGMGKSAILQWLRDHLLQSPAPFARKALLVYIDLSDLYFSVNERVFSAILSALPDKNTKRQSAVPPQTDPYLHLIETLQSAKYRKRAIHVYLLLDNIESRIADPTSGRILVQRLHNLFDLQSDRLRIQAILTATNGIFASGDPHVSLFIRRLRRVYLAPLVQHDVKHVLQEHGVSSSPSVVSHIFNSTGGHPALLHELASALSASGGDTDYVAQFDNLAVQLAKDNAYFSPWVRNFTLYEAHILVELATKDQIPLKDVPQDSYNKLSSAGLVDLHNSSVIPRCRLFYDWLKSQLHTLYSHIPYSRAILTLPIVTTIFRDRLRDFIGVTAINNEKDFHDVVCRFLEASNIDYVSKGSTMSDGYNRFVPDVVLSAEHYVIELKYVHSKDRLRKVKNEIMSRVEVYSRSYNAVLFIVFDNGGYITRPVKWIESVRHSEHCDVIIIKR